MCASRIDALTVAPLLRSALLQLLLLVPCRPSRTHQRCSQNAPCAPNLSEQQQPTRRARSRPISGASGAVAAGAASAVARGADRRRRAHALRRRARVCAVPRQPLLPKL